MAPMASDVHRLWSAVSSAPLPDVCDRPRHLGQAAFRLPPHQSLHPHRRGGVVVLSRANHALLAAPPQHLWQPCRHPCGGHRRSLGGASPEHTGRDIHLPATGVVGRDALPALAGGIRRRRRTAVECPLAGGQRFCIGGCHALQGDRGGAPAADRELRLALLRRSTSPAGPPRAVLRGVVLDLAVPRSPDARAGRPLPSHRRFRRVAAGLLPHAAAGDPPLSAARVLADRALLRPQLRGAHKLVRHPAGVHVPDRVRSVGGLWPGAATPLGVAGSRVPPRPRAVIELPASGGNRRGIPDVPRADSRRGGGCAGHLRGDPEMDPTRNPPRRDLPRNSWFGLRRGRCADRPHAGPQPHLRDAGRHLARRHRAGHGWHPGPLESRGGLRHPSWIRHGDQVCRRGGQTEP